MSKLAMKWVRTGVLGLSLAACCVGTAHAQGGRGEGPGPGENARVDPGAWGLFGLLGLVGLIPLFMRRDDHTRSGRGHAPAGGTATGP